MNNNELLLLYGSNIIKIKELVLSGASVNYESPEGLTPLACAESVEVAEFLIKRGADVNAMNSDGKTALFSVSNLDTCRFLIAAGANVNSLNDKNETALFYTCDMNKIRLLIEAGCDPLVRNAMGLRHYDLLNDALKVRFVNFLANRKKKLEQLKSEPYSVALSF